MKSPSLCLAGSYSISRACWIIIPTHHREVYQRAEKHALKMRRGKSEMAEGLKGGDATTLQAVAALRESFSNKKPGR